MAAYRGGVRWVIVLLLAGCATHDVLRAEPLVARATCSRSGIAVFGHTGAPVGACDAEVQTLGDGCYVAVRPYEWRNYQSINTALGWQPYAPHLFECSATAPDGHVMCLEDELTSREMYVAPATPQTREVHLAGFAQPTTVTLGRCRARLAAWEVANVPRPAPTTLWVGDWRSYDRFHVDRGRKLDISASAIATGVDAVSLHRILGDRERLYATACPMPDGVRITVEAGLPAQVAQTIRRALAPVLAHVPFERCTRLSADISAVHLALPVPARAIEVE